MTGWRAKVKGFPADLCILRTEEGERGSRILSAVSAQTRFTDDQTPDNDGAVVLDDREWRMPGEECVVRTVYSAPELSLIHI